MSKHRSAITGEFVTPDEAAANPDTTVAESVYDKPTAAFWRTQVVWWENQIELHKSQLAEAEWMHKITLEQLKK